MTTFEVQYRDYPAVVSLFRETVEQNRPFAKRFISETIANYNRDINQFKDAVTCYGAMRVDLVIRILKSLRRDYLKRIDASLKLNPQEKSLLKNYIIARYRQQVNPYIGQKRKVSKVVTPNA